MNQDEAIKHSLNVLWKTELCHVGEDCWCRLVLPVEEIKYTYVINPHGEIQETKEDTIDAIIPSGAVDKDTAEYIVEIHNNRIRSKI